MVNGIYILSLNCLCILQMYSKYLRKALVHITKLLSLFFNQIYTKYHQKLWVLWDEFFIDHGATYRNIQHVQVQLLQQLNTNNTIHYIFEKCINTIISLYASPTMWNIMYITVFCYIQYHTLNHICYCSIYYSIIVIYSINTQHLCK